MAENKLPSGVGQKIVKALKQQAEIEINALPEDMESNLGDLPEEDFAPTITNALGGDDNMDDSSDTEAFFSGQETFNMNSYDTMSDSNNDAFNAEDYNFGPVESIAFPHQESAFHSSIPAAHHSIPQPQPQPQPQMGQSSIPSNVAVLRRLITQLPGGVSKQTGAQIIRQTMEALGISMNSVLKEAQQVQDNLNESARGCMSTIQEYKNHIKGLEKQVQDYKKQAVALNDLISLFVLTDNQR